MLSYWILRDAADQPIGLVRVDGDCVLLTASADAPTDFRLFSDDADTPVAPNREMRFAHAVALLGLRNGEAVAFAASPQAQPRSVYQARMSQIHTIIEPDPETDRGGQPPDVPPEPDSVPAAETQTFSDVSETARATEAFSLMLKRAEAFYARFETFHPAAADRLVQKEDNEQEEARGIDLLPQMFPGARWRYVQGKDLLGHYEGTYRCPNGESVRILAVHGKYAPRPPRTLIGFTRFVRSPDGTGYWLRFLPPNGQSVTDRDRFS